MAALSGSLRLVATYGVDWIFIVGLAIGTLLVNQVESRARPFSLTNPTISYPFTVKETVPMSMLALMIVILTIPGIMLGTMVPALWYSYGGSSSGGGGGSTSQSGSNIWRKALWEFHIMILGLAVSGVATIFMTESLKVMIGKPRPDCIARCQPDIAKVSEFIVGGISNQLSTGQLVSKAICAGTDHDMVNDGFKSFPSGHSSGAAVGLGYLSLFLAGKFGLLSLATSWTNDVAPRSVFGGSSRPTHVPLSDDGTGSGGDFNEDDNKLRRSLSSSSAPHASLIVIALAPYAIAIFVAASRWRDYRHHAADILGGLAIGTFFAALGYRFAQLNLLRALGPRPVPVSQPSAALSSSNAEHGYESDKEWGAVPDDEEAFHRATSPDAMNRI